MSELKPCPFCGGEAKPWRAPDGERKAQCVNVHCLMAAIPLRVSCWNTRAPLQYTTEPTEEMIDACERVLGTTGDSVIRDQLADAYRAMIAASPVDTEESE